MRTNVMSKIKGAAKSLCYALVIIVLLWIGKSTVDVWQGNVGKGNFWLLLENEKEMETVIDCVKSKGDNYYTVTVEDTKGNQWIYFDSEYREKGTQLCVSLITDAKEE